MTDKKRKKNSIGNKIHKRTKKNKEENFEDFIKKLNEESNGAFNFSIVGGEDNQDEYIKNMSETKRKKLLKLEEKLSNFNKDSIPLKYKILESNIDNQLKARLLQKAKQFELLNPMQSEYFKFKNYFDSILSIPFGKMSHLPVKNKDGIDKIRIFIQDIKNKLDNCIYGQELAKENLLQIICKKITNPIGGGNIIGLCGPPGIGKTSIIKNGLSKALNMPFGFISLGGSAHAHTLEGFDFTYSNAKWGSIVNILIENKCLNPIIFFDELDKISTTREGEEIISILIHLTDSTQNNSFTDKYFSEIEFDLSKAILIFSFNDAEKINPILRDRINIINLEGFNIEEKIKIAKDFVLKRLYQNIGFDKDKIIIPDETLRVIVSTYCPEKGIRKLEKCLETLIMKINLFDMTKDIKNLTINGDVKIEEPYYIDSGVAVKLLDPQYRRDDMEMSVRMLYS